MKHDKKTLKKILESVLIAAAKPLSLTQLMAIFEQQDWVSNTLVVDALVELQKDCKTRGYELVEVANGWRFQVKQEYAVWVSRLWEEKPQRYSRALLETLALVAYRQPITRGEIEDIRGVSVSSQIMRTLSERNWIKIVGYKDVPGRPSMYATTKEFLDYFNLKSLQELPALMEMRSIDTIVQQLDLLDVINEPHHNSDAVSDTELASDN